MSGDNKTNSPDYSKWTSASLFEEFYVRLEVSENADRALRLVQRELRRRRMSRELQDGSLKWGNISKVESKSVSAKRAILGIDAAWTKTNPSGIALAREDVHGWHLIAVESGYAKFIALAEREENPKNRLPWQDLDVGRLIDAAQELCGDSSIELVAIDMPLARIPITARREADNAISRKYGARYASTHSPSPHRPGQLSELFSTEFGRLGYHLQTTSIVGKSLIEVYPHPALIELTGSTERLPYKIDKASDYWKKKEFPQITPIDRYKKIMEQWQIIIDCLEQHVTGVRRAIGDFANLTASKDRKACEDKLDAIICCVVGILALNGSATPFGDNDSAIWVPRRADG